MWAQERAPKMLKKSNQKGFSIIEVLIVLAIAGLIMLIVFLAVPALQRNARNQARQSDASKFAAAVNQCLSNNNGKKDNCDDIVGGSGVPDGTGVSWDAANDSSQLTSAPSPQTTAATLASASSTTVMTWGFGFRCDGAVASSSGSSTREFVVMYKTEGNGTPQACINS